MEVIKTKFKKTEFGEIPEDWELVSFDKAFSFLSTATYSRAQLSSLAEIKYIHYGDIHTKWFHFIDIAESVLPSISIEQLKNYSLVKEGDLIMADASEDYDGIGKCVEVKNIGNSKIISGLHTYLLRDRGFFHNGFRGYIHSNNFIKSQFDKLATGLKVYGVSKKNLKIVEIPVPSLQEQRAIATALSDMDALLQSLDQLIAKKRTIKQGAMQQLLTPPQEGGKRLDGFNGEWEVKSLGEVADIVGGGTPTTFVAENWSGNINWFTPTEIGKDKYVFESRRKISEIGFNNCSARMLPIGTVLLTSRAGIGDLSILKIESCTNQGFQSLITKDGISNEFIYYLMKTLKKFLMEKASGSTFLEISPNNLRAIIITIPDFKEQTAIAEILTDMDKEIESLETQRAKYQVIKQGMMQELLTGKTRLV